MSAARPSGRNQDHNPRTPWLRSQGFGQVLFKPLISVKLPGEIGVDVGCAARCVTVEFALDRCSRDKPDAGPAAAGTPPFPREGPQSPSSGAKQGAHAWQGQPGTSKAVMWDLGSRGKGGNPFLENKGGGEKPQRKQKRRNKRGRS